MSKPITRQSSGHSIFSGPLSELPLTELPTRIQVAQYFLFMKESKYANNKDVIPELAQTIIHRWNRAGIPKQSLKNVKTKLSRLMEEGSRSSKQGKDTEKTRKFEDSLNSLFDIAGCQCEDMSKCTCDKEMKVPQRERDFLTDQRSTRLMQIAGVDKKVTAMMARKTSRQERMAEREEGEKRRKLEAEHTVSSASVIDSDREDSHSGDKCVVDEWSDVTLQEENITDMNVMPIPTVALEADRYGVSNRAAAAICTVTLIDYGIVTADDRTNIVDHHKVWRARQKGRQGLKESSVVDEEINALFFDGRKDMTLVKEEIENRWYGKKEVEDHYVLVGEPGTYYLSLHASFCRYPRQDLRLSLTLILCQI